MKFKKEVKNENCKTDFQLRQEEIEYEYKNINAINTNNINDVIYYLNSIILDFSKFNVSDYSNYYYVSCWEYDDYFNCKYNLNLKYKQFWIHKDYVKLYFSYKKYKELEYNLLLNS